MNNNITVLLITTLFFSYASAQNTNCTDCYEMQVVDQQNITTELQYALSMGNKICFWNSSGIKDITVILDENIELHETQSLFIQNKINIDLVDCKIKLHDNARISGENHNGSKITKSTPGTAINMIDCDGCSISDVAILGDNEDNPNGEFTALEIDEDTQNSEVSSVNFMDLDRGLDIRGSGNKFNDLLFIHVAGSDECEPEPSSDLHYAIRLLNSNSNNFQNIFHRESPGAVTYFLWGNCNENSMINLSVEQEQSECSSDPSVLISMPNISQNNTILANLNGGGYLIGMESNSHHTLCTFCIENTFNFVELGGHIAAQCPGLLTCQGSESNISCNN